MQKVAILAHHSLREDIIQYLHEQGVLQVQQAGSESVIDHTEVNFRIAELDFAIQTLKEIVPKDVLAASMKSSTPAEVVKAAHHTDVRSIVDSLHRLEEESTQSERLMQEYMATIALFEPWAGLSLPLDAAVATKKTMRILGSMPEQSFMAFQTELATSSILAVVEHISTINGSVYLCATVWKGQIQSFEETATRHGWTSVQLPVRNGTAADVLADARANIAELEARTVRRQKEYDALALHLPNLTKTQVYMQWLTEKQHVREAANVTKNTITLTGWLPAKELPRLETGLMHMSPAIAVLNIEPDEDEEAPVLLTHSKLIAPFVSVTTLYGLPKPSEMDPTSALSPFFILFFSLCLTDAGYGLVLFVLFSIALLKVKKSVEEAPLLWLLWMSGIVTIIVSIPFGGWFGLTPDQVPEFLTKDTPEGRLFIGQIWNLSTQSGISFLQNLALALGITHLFFGMFLSGWHKWIHDQKAAAFWQDFTSHILLAAAGFYIAAPLFEQTQEFQSILLYALYAAIVLAIWGKGYGSSWYVRPIFGLLGMMNLAIGLLSNGLSYLRILALGLVTGAMALAVNQVAVEMGKLFPIYIAIPVIAVIFLGGHLVSIALNTLGSFIHAGRLQFIEFFSQFFEGGGKPFVPFRRSTH